jgi:hypothetical protein
MQMSPSQAKSKIELRFSGLSLQKLTTKKFLLMSRGLDATGFEMELSDPEDFTGF